MKLVIAEKPSVAMSLAAVLGANEKKDGYLEGGGYLVSWCVGHLLELAQQEAYGEQYARWRYGDLPILPETWKYEVPKDKKKQLDLLCRLMKDKRVDSVICATDAGREGELIFRLVYEYAGCKKPMERLWISSHYEDLQKKSDAATASFNALSVQIKELESQMTANGELQKQIVNYAKTRAVYVEYRKAGYSKKFRAAHETEILLHQAAKKHFDELGITKLPYVKSLREEYAGLLEQKRKAYSAYKQARADMKELYNVRKNVEYLLGEPIAERSQDRERK